MDMPEYILIRHKIRNFFEWKKAHDTFLMKRIEIGLIEKYLFRGVEDPNEVTILYQARDLNRARAFFESPQLWERMEKGGVVSKPEISYLSSYSEAVAMASGF
jgi:hypothetical protein